MRTYCSPVPLFACAPVRCGAGIQNRQPQHLRDHHPDHAHLEQPQSAGRRSHPSPHLRVSRQPRGGAWEEQWGSGGPPGASSQRGARPEEDQSGERVFVVGGALPDPGLGQRPVLCYHHCQRGKDLQVRKDVLMCSCSQSAVSPLAHDSQLFSHN